MQAVLRDYCTGCRTTLPQTAMDLLTHATPLVIGLAGTPASVTLPGSCSKCSVWGRLTQTLGEGQRHSLRGDISHSPTPPSHPDPKKEAQASFQK